MEDITKFLKSIRAKRRELSTLLETREKLRMDLLPSAIRYDGDRVQTSPEDRLHEIADELLDLEKVQREQQERLAKDIMKAELLIKEMKTPEYRELLRLRYISGGLRPMTWGQIAKKMGYGEDHVRGKMHGKAIREARKIWKENTLEHETI